MLIEFCAIKHAAMVTYEAASEKTKHFLMFKPKTNFSCDHNKYAQQTEREEPRAAAEE